MGEVKRYDIDEQIRMRGEGNCDELVQEVEFGEYVLHSDYARLERERDECRSAFERAEADVQALVRERDSFREWNGQLDRAVTKLTLERDDADAAASGLCGEVAELTMKLEKAQAELTRLRAVEAATIAYVESIRQCLDPEDPPELLALAEACGRKG